MSLGANQIAAYAADLLDLDEQIDTLQSGKRDLYASIRDEHGKSEADALKRAVKLSRMDAEKRSEAEAIDTEAQRMLAIIEKAGRAPRATREVSANAMPDHSSDLRNMVEADQSTAALKEVRPLMSATTMMPDQALAAPREGGEQDASPVGTQAPPVDTKPAVALAPTATEAAQSGDIADQGGETPPPISDAAKNALRLRPHCLAAMRDEITKCGGYGKVTCFDCSKAHADAEGLAA